MWLSYQRFPSWQDFRPYELGEDLSGVSVSKEDQVLIDQAIETGEHCGGYISRDDSGSQWYVSQAWFDVKINLSVPPVPA